MRKLTAFLFAVLAASALHSAEPLTTPRPVPLTRPEMKVLLEEMKTRTPRIPLPEMTAEEKERVGRRMTIPSLTLRVTTWLYHRHRRAFRFN